MKTTKPYRPNHCFGIERWLGRPLSRLERTVIDPLERERHAGRAVRFIIADGRTDSAAVRSAILTYVAWYSHIVPGQNIILSAPLRRIARRYCRNVSDMLKARDGKSASQSSPTPSSLSSPLFLLPVSARDPEGPRSAYGATALCLLGCDLYPRQTRSFERILAAAVPHIEGRPRPLVIIHGTYHHRQGCCPFRWYTRLALAGRICYNVIHTCDAPETTADPYYKVRSARIAAIDRGDPEPYFAESDRATRPDRRETITLKWLLAHPEQADEKYSRIVADPYIPDVCDLVDAGLFPDDYRRYLIDFPEEMKMLRREEFERLRNPARWRLHKIRRCIAAGQWVPLDALCRTDWEPPLEKDRAVWHEFLRQQQYNDKIDDRRAEEIWRRTGQRPATWQEMHRALQAYLCELYTPRQRHSRRYPRVPLPAGLDRVSRSDTPFPYERLTQKPRLAASPKSVNSDHTNDEARLAPSAARQPAKDVSPLQNQRLADCSCGSCSSKENLRARSHAPMATNATTNAETNVPNIFFTNKIYTGLYPDDLPIVPNPKPRLAASAARQPAKDVSPLQNQRLADCSCGSESSKENMRARSHAPSPFPSKTQTKIPS